MAINKGKRQLNEHSLENANNVQLMEAAAISIAAGTMHRAAKDWGITSQEAAIIYEAALVQAKMVLGTLTFLAEIKAEL